MPENWSLPTITSNYATGVIQAINNKFVDAITLFHGGFGSNMPVHSIHFTGNQDGSFNRWNGSAWLQMRLAVVGGGTGADNPTLARANLGLGTMATQNSNAVAITGGSALDLSGVRANIIHATGELHATSGQNVYQLDAAKITTGIVNPARLGNGAPNSTVFLRGDSLWASPAGTLPSGLIAMFSVACPGGWTRLAAWDGRFPRAMPTYGYMGGVDAHYHDGSGFTVASHAHGAGTLKAASHGHSASGLSVPAHNHGGSVSVSVSGGTNSTGSHDHSFSGTTGGESNGQMNVDAGQSGNMSRASHTHGFSGTTGSDGSHSHTVTASGSGTIPSQAAVGVNGSTGAFAPDVTGSTDPASPGLSGTTGWANHLPYFIDVVFCQKD